MNKSETIGALAAALSKAQSQMEGAKKGAVNPHLGKKYADIASVWDAAREPLAANGLSVVQTPDSSPTDGVILTTMLMHTSGEWVSGETFVPVSKKDAHGYGMAITYARRYALSAMVGVSPEEDDGVAAVQSVQAQQKPPAKTEPKKADGPVRDSRAAKELYAAISGAKSLAELAEVGNTINKRKAEITKAELETLQDDYLAMKKLLEGA